jgi:hypothetical protein
MWRTILLFLALGVLSLRAEQEFSPVISIDSPDIATTFPTGTIKHRSLVWNDGTHTLSAEVTFEDVDQTMPEQTDDTHRFRIPGITLDKVHGIFYATSAKGEAVPVAQRKKTVFLTTIEVLPNAVVRVFHHHGEVSVKLEAIRPSELARVQKDPDDTNSTGTHTINLQDLLP